MTIDVSESGVDGITSEKGAGVGVSAQRRLFRTLITVFFLVYTVLTLFPFYVLFVRTFVGTKDATTLHFWLPPEDPISMDAEIGNLSIFYNLDIKEFKKTFGINGYVGARMTLRDIAEEFSISPEEIQRYFLPYGRYNGWIVLFTGWKIWPAVGRSLVVTLGSLLGINLLGILSGYGLAGLRHRLHMFVYNLYLLEMVLPTMLILLPQFLIVQWFIGLIPDTAQAGVTRYVVQILALIMLNIRGGALSTMLFTSAIGAIPRELEEAAMMDGANRLQYLFRVVLPLMQVHIASLTVIMLPGFWNEFLVPYVYLDPPNTTLVPLIQNYAGQYTTNYQVVYTAVFVSVLPLVIVYVAFRRLFIQGVMAGAIKG